MPSIIKKVLWAVGYASAIYKGCHETYNYVVSEPPQYPHQLQTHHDVAEHVTQQLFPSISLTQTSADNNAGGSVSKLGGHTISSVVVDNGIPLEAVVRVDAPLSPEDFHHLNRDCNASNISSAMYQHASLPRRILSWVLNLFYYVVAIGLLILLIVFIIFIGFALTFGLPSLDNACPDLLGFFLNNFLPTFPASCIRKSWRVLGYMNRCVRSTPSCLSNWITWHLAVWQIDLSHIRRAPSSSIVAKKSTKSNGNATQQLIKRKTHSWQADVLEEKSQSQGIVADRQAKTTSHGPQVLPPLARSSKRNDTGAQSRCDVQLKEDLREQTQLSRAAEKKNKKQAKDLQKMKEELSNSQKEKLDLKAERDQKNEENATLKARVAEFESGKALGVGKQEAQLQDTVDFHVRRLEKLTKELASEKQTSGSRSATILDLNFELTSLTREKEDARAKSNEYKRKAERAGKPNVQLQNQLDNSQLRVSQLEDVLAKAGKPNVQLQNQLGNSQLRVSQLEDALAKVLRRAEQLPRLRKMIRTLKEKRARKSRKVRIRQWRKIPTKIADKFPATMPKKQQGDEQASKDGGSDDDEDDSLPGPPPSGSKALASPPDVLLSSATFDHPASASVAAPRLSPPLEPSDIPLPSDNDDELLVEQPRIASPDENGDDCRDQLQKNPLPGAEEADLQSEAPPTPPFEPSETPLPSDYDDDLLVDQPRIASLDENRDECLDQPPENPLPGADEAGLQSETPLTPPNHSPIGAPSPPPSAGIDAPANFSPLASPSPASENCSDTPHQPAPFHGPLSFAGRNDPVSDSEITQDYSDDKIPNSIGETDSNIAAPTTKPPLVSYPSDGSSSGESAPGDTGMIDSEMADAEQVMIEEDAAPMQGVESSPSSPAYDTDSAMSDADDTPIAGQDVAMAGADATTVPAPEPSQAQVPVPSAPDVDMDAEPENALDAPRAAPEPPGSVVPATPQAIQPQSAHAEMVDASITNPPAQSEEPQSSTPSVPPKPVEGSSSSSSPSSSSAPPQPPTPASELPPRWYDACQQCRDANCECFLPCSENKRPGYGCCDRCLNECIRCVPAVDNRCESCWRENKDFCLSVLDEERQPGEICTHCANDNKTCCDNHDQSTQDDRMKLAMLQPFSQDPGPNPSPFAAKPKKPVPFTSGFSFSVPPPATTSPSTADPASSLDPFTRALMERLARERDETDNSPPDPKWKGKSPMVFPPNNGGSSHSAPIFTGYPFIGTPTSTRNPFTVSTAPTTAAPQTASGSESSDEDAPPPPPPIPQPKFFVRPVVSRRRPGNNIPPPPPPPEQPPPPPPPPTQPPPASNPANEMEDDEEVPFENCLPDPYSTNPASEFSVPTPRSSDPAGAVELTGLDFLKAKADRGAENAKAAMEKQNAEVVNGGEETQTRHDVGGGSGSSESDGGTRDDPPAEQRRRRRGGVEKGKEPVADKGKEPVDDKGKGPVVVKGKGPMRRIHTGI